MNPNKRPFSETFHKVLIYGALWIIGIGMIYIAAANSVLAWEDGVTPLPLIMIGQVILAASGVLLIVARFDLAARRKTGLVKLLTAFLAAAAVFLFDWRIYELNGELIEKSFLFPLLSACWGIAIYRYYRQYDEIFSE